MSKVAAKPKSSWFQQLATRCERYSRALVPDPLIFAALLTGLVLMVACVWPGDDVLRATPLLGRCRALLLNWFDGLWQPGLLAFALQMCLILLAGFGLASAPWVRCGIAALARRPQRLSGAVLLVATVSCIGCWLNWGFGLVSAGLLASALRKRVPAASGRGAILVAAAYCGMMIWHGGFSGSAPLKVARDGVVLVRAAATTDGAAVKTHSVEVAIQATTLSSGNLILSALLIVGIPFVLARMSSSTQDLLPANPEVERKEMPDLSVILDDVGAGTAESGGICSGDDASSLNDRLMDRRWVSMGLALLILLTVALRFEQFRFAAMGLNQVNAIFIGLGLLLHGNVGSYMRALADGSRAIVGIVILFPFYAGIQGLMQDSGLALMLSQAFIDGGSTLAHAFGVDAAVTFTPMCFLSAALVNVFVPSGGGQWIVQGPLMCGAAEGLGVSIPQTVMAISYGDQWTNMIQPFWAIPLMGMTGVKPREFLGPCMLLMLISGPVFILGLLLLY